MSQLSYFASWVVEGADVRVIKPCTYEVFAVQRVLRGFGFSLNLSRPPPSPAIRKDTAIIALDRIILAALQMAPIRVYTAGARASAQDIVACLQCILYIYGGQHKAMY